MKRYLTTKDVCDLLGCSPQTLWRRVNAKSFPAPTYPGKPNKWLYSVIESHEEQQRLDSLHKLRKVEGPAFLR
jgi:predicted DNA-binding transcriptional regulator AlpA